MRCQAIKPGIVQKVQQMPPSAPSCYVPPHLVSHRTFGRDEARVLIIVFSTQAKRQSSPHYFRGLDRRGEFVAFIAFAGTPRPYFPKLVFRSRDTTNCLSTWGCCFPWRDDRSRVSLPERKQVKHGDDR